MYTLGQEGFNCTFITVAIYVWFCLHASQGVQLQPPDHIPHLGLDSNPAHQREVSA